MTPSSPRSTRSRALRGSSCAAQLLGALCILAALSASPAARAADEAPASWGHFTLGLGLHPFYIQPPIHDTPSGYLVYTREIGGGLDLMLDLGWEVQRLRMAVEVGYGGIEARLGGRLDWLFGGPSGWVPVLGCAANTGGSGNELGNYVASMLMLEGGLAYRNDGHSRFMVALRAGASQYYDGEAKEGPRNSTRPALALLVQGIAF